MTYSNGDEYEGQLINCKKDGQGTEKYENGNVYKGSFKDGHLDGYGEYTWKDGSYYKGQFKKGLKHGKGIFFKKAQNDPDKWILFEGNFLEDKRKGYG